MAFSTRGKKEQWVHESAITFIVWLWSLIQRQPWLVIHECTWQFPEHVIRSALSHIYDIESKVRCPHSLSEFVVNFGLWAIVVDRAEPHVQVKVVHPPVQ